MFQTNWKALLFCWHWKWKLLICHMTSVIILSLELEARRSKICQCGIRSQSMTQIFVPQLCQLHLSSGPAMWRHWGGGEVELSAEGRLSSEVTGWMSQIELSLLGVEVKPLSSALLLLLLFWSLFEEHETWLFFCRLFGSVEWMQLR